MFQDCTFLTQAPALPATTLAASCYYYMFYGCTSLTQAPALLATTLVNQCYTGMFYNCTSLTTAPILPATSFDSFSSCYTYMFRGCSNLQEIQVHLTSWNGSSLTSNTASWVDGVASTGTFKCPAALGTQSTITRGVENCPTGWTVVNI